VQHDLLERHEGNGEPDDLPLVRPFIALVVAAAVMSSGCGPSATVAMVSGRDDHGQLLRNAIGLQRSPTDTTITGTVLDGTFVRVLRRDGPWAQVRSAGSLDEGWLQDEYLRGEAVLVDPPPPRRVTFLDVEKRGDVVYVLVRIAGQDSSEWVPATALKEVGAR
jgi:hypothetical protein